MTTTDATAKNTDTPDISLGMYVYDTDDDDPNTAVAVHKPDTQANEHTIADTSETVAEFNPDYPRDDAVVIVVFKTELDEIDASDVSTTESLWPLVQETDIRYYAYPESRLTTDGNYAVEPRLTETNTRFIHRLHITTVGEKLAFGLDFDGVDHQHGFTRNVCFHHKNRDIPEDSAIHIEYEREKHTIKDLPPLLVGITDYRVIETPASPDFLMDL